MEKKADCQNQSNALAVAVLGASAKPERYSNKAVRMLHAMGHDVFPIHPALAEIEGIPVCCHLTDVKSVLHTITVYVSPERSSNLREEIIQAKPKRIIFNPGAENPALAGELQKAGIEVLNTCTLVMLTTGQFGRINPLEPLRACEQCKPCFMRQAEEALAMTGVPEEQKKVLLKEISGLVASDSMGVNPPLVSQKIQRLIRERTGCQDPYQQMKVDLNQAALDMLPEIMKQKPTGMSAQEMAVRMAIAGNILDAGAKSGLQLDEAVHTLGGLFKQPLAGNWERIFVEAARTGSVLYLADNAGEIVFDRILIEMLPHEKVAVAVRGGPVINDAVMEDARTAGICNIVPVISNGADAPGTILEECSPEFRAVFEKSGLIIAKGQGNYETLCAVNKPIVFLFQVKCPVIAAHTGFSMGTLMVLFNQPEANISPIENGQTGGMKHD